MASALKTRSRSRAPSKTVTTCVFGDPMTCASLAALLEMRNGFEVVGGASDFSRLCSELRGHRPQVLVYSAPHHASRPVSKERMAQINSSSSATEIVVVSSSADPLGVRQALREGVRSYVLRSDGPSALLHAVRNAPKGVSYVNPRLGADMVRFPEIVTSELGGKEAEVLRLVALGYTNRQISEKMGIAVRTVEAQRARIMLKLDFSERSELVRYALDNHLIG